MSIAVQEFTSKFPGLRFPTCISRHINPTQPFNEVIADDLPRDMQQAKAQYLGVPAREKGKLHFLGDAGFIRTEAGAIGLPKFHHRNFKSVNQFLQLFDGQEASFTPGEMSSSGLRLDGKSFEEVRSDMAVKVLGTRSLPGERIPMTANDHRYAQKNFPNCIALSNDTEFYAMGKSSDGAFAVRTNRDGGLHSAVQVEKQLTAIRQNTPTVSTGGMEM